MTDNPTTTIPGLKLYNWLNEQLQTAIKNNDKIQIANWYDTSCIIYGQVKTKHDLPIWINTMDTARQIILSSAPNILLIRDHTKQ